MDGAPTSLLLLAHDSGLSGRFALRACFVNHRTTVEDVRTVVSEVLAAAKELAR